MNFYLFCETVLIGKIVQIGNGSGRLVSKEIYRKGKVENDSGGVAAGFGHFTHIEMEAAIFLLYSDRGRNEIIKFPSHKKHRHNCAITVLQRIN